MTYDRGYALQTKSLLVGSDTTAEEVIDQLIDALGLTGSPDDYILEERNHLTQGTVYNINNNDGITLLFISLILLKT